MGTITTSRTANASYYIKLMRDLYGSSLDETQVTDEHVAILDNIIQTELTERGKTVILYRYRFNKSSAFIAETIGATPQSLRLFERDVLHKLRSYILPAPMPIAIEAMELSVRAYNSLKRANVNTLNHIEMLSDQDLRKIRNIGVHCLSEIRQAVKCTIAKRSRLYIGDKIVNYSDIGICPICNGTDHHVVEVDNGYGESYYEVTCNTCNATWTQTFHEIQIDDGYEDVHDGNGNEINVIIANAPLLDTDEIIQNAQLCHACSKSCVLSIDGICRYPLVFGKTPVHDCQNGFKLDKK